MGTSASEKPERASYTIVFADTAFKESKLDLEFLRQTYPNIIVCSTDETSQFAQADVAVLPLSVGEQHCYEWLWKFNEFAQVIVLDKNLSVPKTASAMQNGVVDVLFKPVSTERLMLAVERAVFLGRNPGLSTHRYLWNIFKSMERMNQSHDEARLLHIFSSTLLKETKSKTAILFRDVGTLQPIKSIPAKSDQAPLSRMECLRIGEVIRARFEMGKVIPPEYIELPEGFRTVGLGPVRHLLVMPIRCQQNPMICCFLDPPGVLQKRINLEILASFAQHTAGALDAAFNYQRMSDLVYIDDVTGLYNARYLPLVIENRMKLYDNDKTPFAVLFIDLDRFKEINDTHGHVIGSDVLVKAGHVIRRSVRYDDAVFRYGGDEFVVILSNADPTGGLGAAERIRRNIESHLFDSYGQHISLTCSIGVAAYPQHALGAKDIVDMADKAMYEGKRRSRNVVVLCDQPLSSTGS